MATQAADAQSRISRKNQHTDFTLVSAKNSPVTKRYKGIRKRNRLLASVCVRCIHRNTDLHQATQQETDMSQEQTIRHDFLAQACQYLFGQNARCESFKYLSAGFGMPALQPVRIQTPQNGR